jgi:hypothetical protein
MSASPLRIMTRTMRKATLLLVPLGLLALGCGACGASSSAPAATQTAAGAAPTAASAASASAASSLVIDEHVRAAWQKEGIVPAPLVDDAGFLRRVYLDITGIIPTPEVAAAFLADTAKDKRSKVVDALLESPRYAEHWTDYWDRALLGREVRKPIDRQAFRAFLRDELAENAPWNRFVSDLIAAEGKNGPLGDSPDDAAAMAAAEAQGGMMGDEDDGAPASGSAKVNGAVNWLLKYQNSPQDLAGAASRIFLGVQIQCAQCHDHKTEKWKTDDFQSFAACFATTRMKSTSPKDKKPKDRYYEVDESSRAPRKKSGNPELRAIASATPKGLDGAAFDKSESRRKALAAWMTAPHNPWFSPAIVNRIWAHFMGTGIVEPITDFRPTNPPALPELLGALSKDFVAHGHDLKHLMRLIATSEVYQRSAEGGPADGKLWSRFRPRPLGPAEILDAVVVATKLDEFKGGKGSKSLSEIRRQLDRQMSFLFDVDEEAPERDDFEGSMTQALYLLNGQLTVGASRKVPGSALAEILAMPGGEDAKIKALYLRVLSREPSAEELVELGKRLGDRRSDAYEDLLWALLNSSEFTFNH